MASVNKVILIGNVGRDAEMKYTASGQARAVWSIATSKKYGEPPQEVTTWHTCIAWAKNAEIAAQYIRKGRQVFVEGELSTRDWVDVSGVKHYKTEVIVQRFVLLGSKDAEPDAYPGYATPKPMEIPSGVDDYDIGPLSPGD